MVFAIRKDERAPQAALLFQCLLHRLQPVLRDYGAAVASCFATGCRCCCCAAPAAPAAADAPVQRSTRARSHAREVGRILVEEWPLPGHQSYTWPREIDDTRL